MNIIFVCLGNICRSVMAEMIFKNILNENNINNIKVDSCGTSEEEEGNPIYPAALEKLNEKEIKVYDHVARKITLEDYNKNDLIICMDEENINSILRMIGMDKDNKIHLLAEYTSFVHGIADPWYTRDFETAYNEIYDGCLGLFNSVRK